MLWGCQTRDERQCIVDKDALPLEYDHLFINEDGISGAKWGSVTKWLDLMNGFWYDDLSDVGCVSNVPSTSCVYRSYCLSMSPTAVDRAQAESANTRYCFSFSQVVNGISYSCFGKACIMSIKFLRITMQSKTIARWWRQAVSSEPS